MTIHGQHWWLRGYSGAVAFLLVYCAAIQLLGAFQAKTIAARSGMKESFSEIVAGLPKPSGEKNASEYYVNAFRMSLPFMDKTLWKNLPGGLDEKGRNVYWGHYPRTINEEQRAGIEKIVTGIAPAIEELRKAAKAPASCYPLKFDEDSRYAVYIRNTETTEYAVMRTCSDFLHYCCLYYSNTGDAEKACDMVELMAATAKGLAASGVYTHALCIVIYDIWDAWADMQRRLSLSESQLSRLAGALAHLPGTNPTIGLNIDFLHKKWGGWQEKYVDGKWEIEEASVRPKITSWLNDWTFHVPIDLGMEALAFQFATKKDFSGFHRLLNTSPMENRPDKAPLFFYDYKSAFSRMESWEDVETRRYQIVISIALERFSLAKGLYPPTLDALVPEYLDAVPGGTSIRYSTDGKSYQLFHIHVSDTNDVMPVLKGEGKQ